MALAARAEDPRYTFADYLSWDENERIELIDGEPFMMAPPTSEHQFIIMELSGQIWNYLRDKKCKVVTAPFGVRLFEQEGDHPRKTDTVVEPDIVVMCDTDKIDRHGYRGAPDMVIEIVSPSSRRRDWLIKLQQYQKAGVKEYWIVSPDSKTVHVFLHDGSTLALHDVCGDSETVKVNVLEDCTVDLSLVFPGQEP